MNPADEFACQLRVVSRNLVRDLSKRPGDLMNTLQEPGVPTSDDNGRSGRPLLFVHGMWHAGWCWERYVRLFRQAGFNAHALNLRYHGLHYAGRRRSARLWRPLLGTYVKDLKREAARFETPPILVGHSLGCYLIEIAMADIRPPAVVLLAPTRPDIFARSVNRFRKDHPREFWRLFFTLTMWPPISTPELCAEMLISPKFPKDEVLKLHQEKLQNESYWVASQLLLGSFRLGSWLGIARRPSANPGAHVTVIGGALDRAVLVEDVKAVAASYGVEAEIIPEMGHDLMLDVGGDSIAQRILERLG